MSLKDWPGWVSLKDWPKQFHVHSVPRAVSDRLSRYRNPHLTDWEAEPLKVPFQGHMADKGESQNKTKHCLAPA